MHNDRVLFNKQGYCLLLVPDYLILILITCLVVLSSYLYASQELSVLPEPEPESQPAQDHDVEEDAAASLAWVRSRKALGCWAQQI